MILSLAFRSRLLSAAALMALAVITPIQARAAELVYHASHGFDVVVDGAYQPNARVFQATEPPIRFLLDIPSQSMAFLVNTLSKKAVAVSRWHIKPGETNDVIRADVADASDASSYAVFSDGEAMIGFRTGSSEVRLMKASEHPTFTGSGGEAKPITPSAEARACLRLESLPAPVGTPGCAKFVYLKNSCNVPVVADMSRTEHLLSGTLPQTFQIIVTPSGEQSLGCDWWSGATAPSETAIQSAGFLPEPDKHGHGNKDHASRH
jgi:hypothetical protein